MENEQELSAQADSNVQDIKVDDKFNKPEFNRATEPDPIEKLADDLEAKLEKKDEPTQSELSNKDSDKSDKVPPKENFDIEKWDGKVEALPEKLRKIVTDNQAAYTAKAQEVAELRKELEQRTIAVNTAKDQPLMTPEEFEEAQLSPAKMEEVVNRIAMRAIEKKAAELMPVITQVQHTQRVVENEKAINDFASQHEDFWELHDASPKLFMSLIQQTKSLQETYETLKQFKNAESQKAKQEAQGRIKEKKNASTFSRSTNQTENVMYINGTKEDVLRKQIELAMQGKKIQVKLKN